MVQTHLDGTGYTRVIRAGPAYRNLNGVAVLESAPPVPLTIVPFAITPLLVLWGVVGMSSKRRE